MLSRFIAGWLLLLPSVLWAQALSPGGPMAQKDVAPELPPPYELPATLPDLSEPVVIDPQPICARALPLTSEVREHLAHPTPETAYEAVRSQVEAMVRHHYAMALMEAERQRQLATMQDEGFEPPQSQGGVLRTLAMAYGMWIPQDGLPPGYDLFAAADKQAPGALAKVKLKQLITWYHQLACGG